MSEQMKAKTDSKCIQPGPSSIPANFDIDRFDDWKVEDFPLGMVGAPGNSVEYYTGGWRHEKPIWNEQACKNCMLCWMNCADTAILMGDAKVEGVEYDHCKGCGVCEIECRFGAMTMVSEHEEFLANGAASDGGANGATAGAATAANTKSTGKGD